MAQAHGGAWQPGSIANPGNSLVKLNWILGEVLVHHALFILKESLHIAVVCDGFLGPKSRLAGLMLQLKLNSAL